MRAAACGVGKQYGGAGTEVDIGPVEIVLVERGEVVGDGEAGGGGEFEKVSP